MGLQEYERILWGRLGDIETVKSTSPRLIERVVQEAQKAIEGAKVDIELAEEMDLIMFYSKALGLLLWVRDGHSGPNRDMVRQLVKDKIKAVHPFPYVDDPMWNTEGFNPSISEVVKNFYKGFRSWKQSESWSNQLSKSYRGPSSIHSGYMTRVRIMMRLTCFRLYSGSSL